MWETPVKKVIRFEGLDAAVKINAIKNPVYILIDNREILYVTDKLS